MAQRPSSHAREHKQIEEVHQTQHQQHQSDLCTEVFNRFLGVHRRDSVFQGERHVADVDEVKPDHEQMIHRIGQLFVAKKAVHEKDSSVPVQCTGDPYGEGHTYGEIGDVGCYDPVHIITFYMSDISVLTEI